LEREGELGEVLEGRLKKAIVAVGEQFTKETAS
jgi:hypothetical protein